MDSDKPCAVCGTETTYHQQTINGSTLTRCRRHSPKRGRVGAVADRLTPWVFAVGIPATVAAAFAHLFTGFSLHWTGRDLPPKFELVEEMWWYVAIQTLGNWAFTAVSAVIVVSSVLLAVMLVYEKLRPAEVDDG